MIQVALPATEQTLDVVNGVVTAVQSHNWSVAAGGVLMLLSWLANRLLVSRFRKEIPKKAMPWVVSVVGVIGAVATNLYIGRDVFPAVVNGSLVGASAVGLWEMIGRHLLKKPVLPGKE